MSDPNGQHITGVFWRQHHNPEELVAGGWEIKLLHVSCNYTMCTESVEMVKYYDIQVFVLPSIHQPVLQPRLAWAAPFPLIVPNLFLDTP